MPDHTLLGDFRGWAVLGDFSGWACVYDITHCREILGGGALCGRSHIEGDFRG